MDEMRFARRLQNMGGNVIRELLKLTQQPNIISFAGGLPSPDTFPVAEIKEAMERILDEQGASILQYGTTEGYEPLRKALVEFVRPWGFDVSHQDILVLSGSQQGIDLVAKAMLNPGDKVIVESPTYLAAVQIFKTYEVEFIIVPSDETGADVNMLEQLILKHQPKMLYLVPTFQNPSGATMTLSKRRQVAELLSRHQLLLVEDDPYGCLRFSGDRLPAISALDDSGQSVYLGSFSKIVSPGLRLGYAIAQADVLRKMTIGKQGTDVHTNQLSQAIVATLLDKDMLRTHIQTIIEMYVKKRDTMLKAMKVHFPPQARWNTPDGGLFIWVEMPEHVDTTELFRITVEHQVAFVPGISFFADESQKNCLRLNFSNATSQDIETGIARLGVAMKQYLQTVSQ